MKDKTRLVKALRESGARGFHVAAAEILWSVNGIDSALGYVRALREKGLIGSYQLAFDFEEEERCKVGGN